MYNQAIVTKINLQSNTAY